MVDKEGIKVGEIYHTKDPFSCEMHDVRVLYIGEWSIFLEHISYDSDNYNEYSESIERFCNRYMKGQYVETLEDRVRKFILGYMRAENTDLGNLVNKIIEVVKSDSRNE